MLCTVAEESLIGRMKTASHKGLLSSSVRNIREEFLEMYILEHEAKTLCRKVGNPLERETASVPEKRNSHFIFCQHNF